MNSAMRSAEIEAFERDVEQIIQEAASYWEPFLAFLGLRVSMYIARSKLTPYKSTLDLQVSTEGGKTLWFDSLILYMEGERWVDLEEVKIFLKLAIQRPLSEL